ncbi:hypothetical protein C8J57DRAFT_1228155 [Mycena rebaudengoi]|nr:hypothetical protein C8J57DRAFT_1228155 [Mycena rebaudengoi]
MSPNLNMEGSLSSNTQFSLTIFFPRLETAALRQKHDRTELLTLLRQKDPARATRAVDREALEKEREELKKASDALCMCCDWSVFLWPKIGPNLQRKSGKACGRNLTQEARTTGKDSSLSCSVFRVRTRPADIRSFYYLELQPAHFTRPSMECSRYPVLELLSLKSDSDPTSLALRIIVAHAPAPSPAASKVPRRPIPDSEVWELIVMADGREVMSAMMWTLNNF